MAKHLINCKACDLLWSLSPCPVCDSAIIIWDDQCLNVLAANLATAAALERAYFEGCHYGFWEGGCRVSSDDPDEVNPNWRPGCGVRAPGWET